MSMFESKVMEMLRDAKPIGEKPLVITPASGSEIERFEQYHSLRLPEELKNWFRHCNGAEVSPGGLKKLFSEKDVPGIDWYLEQYPDWRAKKWLPLAGDGSGDLYMLEGSITIPSTKTHPVFFLDQSDFSKADYIVASGVWKFLYFYLETENLWRNEGVYYWPFDRDKVVAIDPAILECECMRLPWQA